MWIKVLNPHPVFSSCLCIHGRRACGWFTHCQPFIKHLFDARSLAWCWGVNIKKMQSLPLGCLKLNEETLGVNSCNQGWLALADGSWAKIWSIKHGVLHWACWDHEKRKRVPFQSYLKRLPVNASGGILLSSCSYPPKSFPCVLIARGDFIDERTDTMHYEKRIVI